MKSTEPTEAHQTRDLRKKINAVISFGTGVVVACAIMMWSVFNAWTNVLTFFANNQEGQAWWVTCLLVLLTCLVPFALGIWMLVRTIGKFKPA